MTPLTSAVCVFNLSWMDDEQLFANCGAESDGACVMSSTAAVVCVIVGIRPASYAGISGGKSALVGTYHARNECLVFAA